MNFESDGGTCIVRCWIITFCFWHIQRFMPSLTLIYLLYRWYTSFDKLLFWNEYRCNAIKIQHGKHENQSIVIPQRAHRSMEDRASGDIDTLRVCLRVCVCLCILFSVIFRWTLYLRFTFSHLYSQSYDYHLLLSVTNLNTINTHV